MDTAEAFRLNAEACSKMADKSPDPWDRANWMRLAESWTRLAKTSAKTGAKTKAAAKPGGSANDVRQAALAAPATLEAGARRKRGRKKTSNRRRAPRKSVTGDQARSET
jgi:hypothetical protein